MANIFAFNDAVMASPRPRLAAPARTLPPLQIAGEGMPVSGSPVAIADPEKERTGELALSKSQIAQVSTQLARRCRRRRRKCWTCAPGKPAPKRARRRSTPVG